MAEQYNLNNPSVKRIMKEVKEMERETSTQFRAVPLEDNLFEWHFTIRGPQDTDFQGGIYHGRISLPSEYPFKPPNIILLTPNGRFEVGKKICLSISAHHPEYWQPSWSIRTVLVALISFMPTKGDGAIGALDYKPEERKALAEKSKIWKCEGCGSSNETALPPEEIETCTKAYSSKEETDSPTQEKSNQSSLPDIKKPKETQPSAESKPLFPPKSLEKPKLTPIPNSVTPKQSTQPSSAQLTTPPPAHRITQAVQTQENNTKDTSFLDNVIMVLTFLVFLLVVKKLHQYSM